MALKTTLWDPSEYLDSPESIAAYLEAAFEDGDPALVAAALGDIARAMGMTQLASRAGVTREALYKALSATGDPKLSGKEYRIEATLKDGLSQENAKKIGKIIREQGPKGVKAQITGDELRVSAKSRDDLQTVQALVKNADLDFAVQFVNYR